MRQSRTSRELQKAKLWSSVPASRRLVARKKGMLRTKEARGELNRSERRESPSREVPPVGGFP
jgi:hypothetical protein